MLSFLLKKILGSRNERELKKLQPLMERILEQERDLRVRSDMELKQKSSELIRRCREGKESPDSLLCPAFALVREAAKRTILMRPFDVQVAGAIVLHQGRIAEMKTGEGKTLVATMPAYLNALTGKGVHIVTVNDYLARRDAEWMGEIYRFLGLQVDCLQNEMPPEQRKSVYSGDIIYGTNSEFGFDYLRDNMEISLERCVQRSHHYAIIDEVDSILVDEARTPLIISGPAEESTEKYTQMDGIARTMKQEAHFTVDEKARTVFLTEKGNRVLENRFGEVIYTPDGIDIQHHMLQALKAHYLFKGDVDYVKKDGEIIIVDEFTGRLMPGRRYSEGLHQALEAKEHVPIKRENQTLATITIQNYFRMYDKLAGMTGTAKTEEAEFIEIYNLEVMQMPTNRPLIRRNFDDEIYKTEEDKFNAVIDEITRVHDKGRPILVGTISIDKSEKLSRLLKQKKIGHSVLNAKNHEREAEIVAKAGQRGAVTISTNMAGRGTDIVLGDTVAERGGLHIVGTERHEARRIDNQLRGRAGRQGDPGSSKFFLSLGDDLMRIFAGEKVKAIMSRIHVEEGVPIKHPLITRMIERAQRQVEARNFEIRKHTLQYDDVMNKQREVIYQKRREILERKLKKNDVMEMIADSVDEFMDLFLPADQSGDDWDFTGLKKELAEYFACEPAVLADRSAIENREHFTTVLLDELRSRYDQREAILGSDNMRRLEGDVFVHYIDMLWKDHLYAMDHLREGIGLRGYAQRDPLVEYKKEAFLYFDELIDSIKKRTIKTLYTVNITPESEELKVSHRQVKGKEGRGEQQRARKAPVRTGRKIGRNEPCPCGSGKKYKHCCGR